MPSLHWKGPTGTRRFTLGRETHIGRSPRNHLPLPETSVSSFHASIFQEGGNWILKDNNSTNGTYVNGSRVDRVGLRDGDRILLGAFDLRFSLRDGPERPPEPPAAIRGLSAIRFEAPAVTESAEEAQRFVSGIANVTTLGVVRAVGARPRDAEGMDRATTLARRLDAFFEISTATASALTLPEVLDRVLAALFGIFRSAERALVLLAGAAGRVETAAARRRSGEEARDIAVSQTALKQALERREAVLCADAMADDNLSAAQSIVNIGVRSMMIAPMVFHDQALGAIYVDTRTGVGQFAQSDLELLSVAAGQVAARVANAQLHEKVVQNERLAAVGQTVAGLTHCIKNILQGIQGGAYVVDAALASGDQPTLARGWEMVKRNNRFMEDLVFDLLSLSKQRPPEYQKTDLNVLCAEACELPRARGAEQGVPVTFVPGEGIGEVELDGKGIKRCLLNLTMNAVDACAAQRKGEVAVSTRRAGADGLVRIAVTDTGPGMSEDVVKKLFTVFFSTKGAKGTGLGLSVSRKIVEEHGGRIDVESEAGKGTTFTICLPPRREGSGADLRPGA